MKASSYARLFLSAIFGLAIIAVSAHSESSEELWHSNIDRGLEALHQGRLAESEQLFSVAALQAQNFGETDSRLATSLNNLGTAYQAQKNMLRPKTSIFVR